MPRLVVVLALAVLAWNAPAQETVFYKCTDAKGQVSMQNGTPCAAGMKQEIRRVGAVKTVPVPPKRAVVAEPPALPPQYGEFVLVRGPAPQRQPAPEAATLPAPAPLYQCTTWQGDTYAADTGTPEPSCVPLQVMGIDGSAALGMGSACEMKQDACKPVPDEQLCVAWYQRLDETEFKLRYATDETRHERQAAHDAVAAKIRASRCSTTAPVATGGP